MRWAKTALYQSKKEPLLLLPLDAAALPSAKIGDNMTGKGLRLFTKTWRSKRPKDEKKEKKEKSRPLTATLDRPQVLDIRFIGKVDMSLVTKELFLMENLYRGLPGSLNVRQLKTAFVDRKRPLAVIAPTSRANLSQKLVNQSDKKQSKSRKADTSSEDESLRTAQSKKKAAGKARQVVALKKLGKPAEINNNNSLRKAESISGSPISRQVPEPCTTCGRPDLPERFHSHPVTPNGVKSGAARKSALEVKIPTKNSVQKPVAIRYQSKLESAKRELHMAPLKSIPRTPNEAPKSSKGPRTLTCYLCGREFGTASLPLHEPKCLEKWERENNSLPVHLRKKPPTKPETSLTKEEWNKRAWEASQSSLTPCPNCKRTFLPDRLVVHLRSCKEPTSQRGPSANQKEVTSPTLALSVVTPNVPLPSLIACTHCGKLFGSKSIKIHEPQCLKKLNSAQSAGAVSTVTTVPSEATRSASRRPSMLPCYLCGRLFSLSSIYIHEPQCLKKWRAENDKLPPSKRRPEPQRPDIKFTPTGNVDFKGTFNRIWENHLHELSECPNCHRTFFPNRLEVHRKVCKGN